MHSIQRVNSRHLGAELPVLPKAWHALIPGTPKGLLDISENRWIQPTCALRPRLSSSP